MVNSQALRGFIEGGRVNFKEGSVSFIFTCPRCGKDRKLYIRKTDGRFVCFVCREKEGFQGKAEYALSELYGMSIQQIQEIIYDHKEFQAKDTLNLTFKNPFEEEEIEEEFNFLFLPQVTYHSNIIDINDQYAEKGKKYLIEQRGLNEECIQKFKLKYNLLWETVVFPVYSDDQLIGWQERSIKNGFKYTLKDFKKEKALMFQDELRGSNHAILCEGPIDALKTYLCGGGVASMGKGVSPQQLDILKEKVKVLYIALDPDASAEIQSIARHMYGYMDQIYIMSPPKGKKDLGECTFEEVYEQFKKAIPYYGQVFLNLREI